MEIDLQIHVEKIEGKTDSFFYPIPGEVIASFESDNNIYNLISSGDIRIDIDDEIFRNRNVDDAVSKFNLNDKLLNELEGDGRLRWENNNWFEVLFRSVDSDTWKDKLGEVAHDYDSGIQLLKDVIREEEGD